MILFTILLLLSFVCVGLAAICNAKMDKVSFQFFKTIYAGKERQWFDPTLSWINKHNPEIAVKYGLMYLPKFIHFLVKKKPGWAPLSDFWHWQKSLMISYLIASGAFAFAAGYAFKGGWGLVAIGVVVLYVSKGILWNIIFNIYYDGKLIFKDDTRN